MLPRPEDKPLVQKDRLVLVEGQDEVNLFNAIIRRGNIIGLQVLEVGGREKFKGGLDAVLANARIQNIQLSAISIMRDADDDLNAAFDSVKGVLSTFDMAVPLTPGEFAAGSPSVGVFILPDNQSLGAVEELCWRSVTEMPAAQCSAKYLECLKFLGALMSRNSAKTLVHAYLAAQEEPSTTVGIGALKGYWPVEHSAFAGVREFLEGLASI